MDLKEVDILGPDIGAHWYYASKAKAMRRLLGETGQTAVLDVGAGSGFFAKHLLEATPVTAAICVDTSYQRDSDAMHAGKPVAFRRAIEATDARLALFMDVLEHVEDDVGLLALYRDVLPSGARILITVPAFRFLWSGHDDFLGHYRRYTVPMMEAAVGKAGLKVERGAYYFASVFPIAAAMRLAGRIGASGGEPNSQMRRHSPPVNAVLAALCSAELPVFPVNRAFGLSVFCLATKP